MFTDSRIAALDSRYPEDVPLNVPEVMYGAAGLVARGGVPHNVLFALLSRARLEESR